MIIAAVLSPLPMFTDVGLVAAISSFFATALHPMALFGWVGQGLFFSRFLIQWLVSERVGRSTIPVMFWYLSLLGGGLFLIYALWRHDPVLVLGQAVGLVVYTRNLILIARTRSEGVAASST